MKTKQRDAGSLKELSAAAGESWRDIKQSADAILGSARATTNAVVERFRNALQG